MDRLPKLISKFRAKMSDESRRQVSWTRTSSSRPTQLQEIGFDTWREWDANMANLKSFFMDNYQDMHTIIADPLSSADSAAYKSYETTMVKDKADYKTLDRNTEVGKALARSMVEAYLESIPKMSSKIERQSIEKTKAYYVIRSMCSDELNLFLGPDEEFIACDIDDPLTLLAIIKRLIFSRRTPYEVEVDRIPASRNWYTLKMGRGEDVTKYGHRAVKLYNRLVTTASQPGQLPTPAEQGMMFVVGLDDGVQAFRHYKYHLKHMLMMLKDNLYPKTLTEAIDQAMRVKCRQ